jgi:hypothetical protein
MFKLTYIVFGFEVGTKMHSNVVRGREVPRKEDPCEEGLGQEGCSGKEGRPPRSRRREGSSLVSPLM